MIRPIIAEGANFVWYNLANIILYSLSCLTLASYPFFVLYGILKSNKQPIYYLLAVIPVIIFIILLIAYTTLPSKLLYYIINSLK